MTQVALFTVWNLNGGPVDEGAITRIEKSIERILNDVEKNESARYVTQTTRADAEVNADPR